jgi:hypothetical protein
MLRTIELIAGMNSLSLNDAFATPMYQAFVHGSEAPDDTPYDVIVPEQNIGEKNTSGSADASISQQLPWSRMDVVPQGVSDKILWASVHGASVPAPAPGPHAAAAENALSQRVWRTLTGHAELRGQSVDRLLPELADR